MRGFECGLRCLGGPLASWARECITCTSTRSAQLTLPPSLPPTHKHGKNPGRNPFDGYTPSVPEGERLDFASDRFMELEAKGLGAVARAAFVLVAGGLGERLGYSGEWWGVAVGLQWELGFRKKVQGLHVHRERRGFARRTRLTPCNNTRVCARARCETTGIKVALPAESASGRGFLQLYVEFILALQVGTAAAFRDPLAHLQ